MTAVASLGMLLLSWGIRMDEIASVCPSASDTPRYNQGYIGHSWCLGRAVPSSRVSLNEQIPPSAVTPAVPRRGLPSSKASLPRASCVCLAQFQWGERRWFVLSFTTHLMCLANLVGDGAAYDTGHGPEQARVTAVAASTFAF